jgi:tripartite-type tricarboxylate transporter receptor subunit TctC
MGVTTLKRSPTAPDIPTLAEAGLPGYNVSTWHGLVAPAGTPPAIIDRLHDEVVRALASPAVQKSFAEGGIIAVSSTPEQFAAYTKSELIRWRAILKATGVTQQ